MTNLSKAEQAIVTCEYTNAMPYEDKILKTINVTTKNDWTLTVFKSWSSCIFNNTTHLYTVA